MTTIPQALDTAESRVSPPPGAHLLDLPTEEPMNVTSGLDDIPDLLSHVPMLRVDAPSLRQTLTFAFASGAPSSAFEQAIVTGPLPESAWEPREYEAGLFVSEFVALLKVKAGRTPYCINRRQLTRELLHPPADRRDVELRRGILAELSDRPELVADVERATSGLQRFLALLEAPPLGRRGFDANRRRLDILAALKSCLDALAGSFADTTSGLRRARDFAAAIVKTESYERLSQLLDYHEHFARVRLEICLGVDGRINSLDVLSVRENENNWFYRSPVLRWLTKITLLLRGYRFGEEEVLARLIQAVYDSMEPWLVRLVQLSFGFEFYLGALAFRSLAQGHGQAVCLPEIRWNQDAHEPIRRELLGLYNPLLFASSSRVVATDLVNDLHQGIMVVTGPNSGGKTRLLQAVGLTQLLGQAGFFVPAQKAVISSVSGLFVSFIEGTQADQTEGRLGTELLRIRALFEHLDVGAMIILDELCSGTNPSEGEQIFEMVVSLLAELEPQAFITTHFLALAQRLARQSSVKGLSFRRVELDEQNQPTYQFLVGVADTSLAQQTAARLGVTREELLHLVHRRKRSLPPPR